jgi:hypothetical protein
MGRGDERCEDDATYFYPSGPILLYFCEKHTLRWAKDNEFGKKGEPLKNSLTLDEAIVWEVMNL